MNGPSDKDSKTFLKSSHSEIRVTDPMQTEMFDPLTVVNIKTEVEDGEMEDNLKVVEVVEQLEVNVIVENHATYLQDKNGVKLYVLGPNGTEFQPWVSLQGTSRPAKETVPEIDIKEEKFIAVSVCSECGSELNTSVKEGPICVKCIVGSFPSPKISNPNIYKKHYLGKSLRKNHVCSICKDSFSRFVDLKDHSYSCSAEKLSTKKEQSLETTQKEMKTLELDSYTCAVCSRIFYNFDVLKKHIDSHMGEGIMMNKKKKVEVFYTCIVCESKKFTTPLKLKKHYLTHETEGSFKCKFCPQHLEGRKEVSIHSVVHNRKSAPYDCEECPTTFQHIAALRAHTFIHLEQKIYSCSKCNKSYGQVQRLKYHEKTHDPDALTCKDCKRQFKRSGHLKRHYCPLRKRLLTGN